MTAAILTEDDALFLVDRFDQLDDDRKQIAQRRLNQYRARQEFVNAPMFPSQATERLRQAQQLEGLWLDGDEGWAKHRAEGEKQPWSNDHERGVYSRAYALSQIFGIDGTEAAVNEGKWRTMLSRKWERPEIATDDAAYNTAIKEHLLQKRERRAMHVEMMEAVAAAAHERQDFDRAYTDWHRGQVGRRAYQGQLATDWSQDARKAYNAERRRRADAEVRGERLYALLQSEMQGDGPELLDPEQSLSPEALRAALEEPDKQEAAINLLAGQHPRQVALILDEVSQLASGRQQDKGMRQKLAESVYRALERLNPDRFGRALPESLTWLRFQEGDEVLARFADSPNELVRWSQRTSIIPGASAESILPGGDTVELTADQAARANEAIAVERERWQTEFNIRQVAQGVVDPIRKDWWGAHVLYGGAETMTSMATYALPYGTGLAANASVYVHEAEMEALNQGIDPETARDMALGTGLVQAALDRVQFGLLSKAPGFRKLGSVIFQPGSQTLRVLGRAAGIAGAETAIEVAQDPGAPALVQDIFNALEQDVPDVDWGEIQQEAWAQTPEVALSMILPALLGAGAVNRQDVKDADALVTDDATNRALGFDDAQRKRIRESDDPVATFQEEFQNRGDGDAEAIAEIAEEVAKLPAADATANVAAGVAELRRSDEGWEAQLQDGGVVSVPDAEAATILREQLAQARDEAEANAMVELENFLAEADAELRADQEQQAFTGEVARVEDTGAVVFSRDGEVTRILNDARTVEEVQREVELLNRQDAGERGAAAGAVVLGQNRVEFAESVATDAATFVRSEVYQGGGVFAQVHERVEGRFRAALKQGIFTRDEALGIVRRVEEITGMDFLPATGLNDTMLREAVSDIVTADVLSRRREEGTNLPGNAIRAGVTALIQRAQSPRERGTMKTFRSFMRAARSYFGQVFRASAALKRARRRGEMDTEVETFLNRLVGIDEQAQHNQAVAAVLADDPAALGEPGFQVGPEIAEVEGGASAPADFLRGGPGSEVAFSVASAEYLDRIAESLARRERPPAERLRAFERARERVSGLAESLRASENVSEALTKRAIEEEYRKRRDRQFERETKGVTDEEQIKQARRVAQKDADAWRTAEMKKLSRRQVRAAREEIVTAIRAMDAVLVGLPAEVRGRVGGFARMATLGTAEAREKHLQSKVRAMDRELERYLQREYRKGMHDLLKQARPKAKAGEKPAGHITPEGHRFFAKIEEVAHLTDQQVEELSDTLTKREADIYADENLTEAEKDAALADNFEDQQIVDQFGAFFSNRPEGGRSVPVKTAAEMAGALEVAAQVFADGKNRWRQQEEVRIEQNRRMVREFADEMGSPDQSKIAARDEERKKLLTRISDRRFSFLSFAQVVESILGPAHPLAKRFIAQADAAETSKTDRMIEVRARFENFVRRAMAEASGGKVSKLKAAQRVFEMNTERTITVDKREGSLPKNRLKIGEDQISIELAGQIARGADPAPLGLSLVEAKEVARVYREWDQQDRKNPNQKFLKFQRHEKGRVSPYEMTEAEAIMLTLSARQEQVVDKLDAFGFNEEVRKQAEDGISSEGKLIRGWLAQEFTDNYEPLAAVFRRMAGVDLPKHKNYSPTQYYHDGIQREMDAFGEGLMPEGGMRAGFLKSRKAHMSRPRIESAFSVYMAHMAQTEHYIAWAEPLREMRAVMGSSEVALGIQARYGKATHDALMGWLEAFERNGLETAHRSQTWLEVVRGIKSRLALIALAYKAGTLMVQSTAALYAMARMPMGQYWKGMGKLLTGQLPYAKIFKTDAIQRRIKAGYSPEVRAVMSQNWQRKPTWGAEQVNRGMEVIGLVDAFFTTAGATIAYDYEFQRSKEQGLSDAMAEANAISFMEETVRRTAQPADLGTRSLAELSTHPMAQLLWMFASDARKNTAIEMEAMANWKKGRSTRGEMLRVVFMMHALGLMADLIRSAWWDARDDDDDELFDEEHWEAQGLLMAALTGPVEGFPLLNDLASAAGGFESKGPLAPVVRGAKAAMNVFSGEVPKSQQAEPVEYYQRQIQAMAIAAGMVADRAVPIAVAANVVDQIFDVADNFYNDVKEAERKEKRRKRKEKQKSKE